MRERQDMLLFVWGILLPPCPSALFSVPAELSLFSDVFCVLMFLLSLFGSLGFFDSMCVLPVRFLLGLKNEEQVKKNPSKVCDAVLWGNLRIRYDCWRPRRRQGGTCYLLFSSSSRRAADVAAAAVPLSFRSLSPFVCGEGSGSCEPSVYSPKAMKHRVFTRA